MRRSLRFFSSCSSSSVIVGFPFEQKVLPCHAAQDHPFHAIQIVKTIPSGLAHGAQQRFPWILPHQAQQLPQGKRDHLAAPLFQPHDIVGQFRRGCDAVSYTHLRAHETVLDLVCRLLLEKKKNKKSSTS